MSRRSMLRGGLYHLSLLIVTFNAFNWGFARLTSIDIFARIVQGVTVPGEAVAIVLCVASILVLWNNWVD